MDANVLDMTAELANAIRRNSSRPLVDPRAVPARFSTLKMFAQSPAHYLSAVQQPLNDNLSMRIGSGTHAILFKQPFAVWTGKVRNGNAWELFAEQNRGKLILNTKEYDEACYLADAVRNHDTASHLLFDKTRLETRIDWEWMGKAFRSTPDAASSDRCVDLKCLRSSDPDQVMWQSSKMFYHAQAALYRRALSAVSWQIQNSYLVVVENKPPYPVTVLRFTERALGVGDMSCRLWLEQLLACEAANHYPGYVQSVIDLDLPGGSGVDQLIFDDGGNE